jgi:hypothetical protein
MSRRAAILASAAKRRYHDTVWRIDELSFEIDDAMTAAPVVTLVVTTPDAILRFLGEPEPQGTTLLVRGVHVQGGSANRIGARNLGVIAQR